MTIFSEQIASGGHVPFQVIFLVCDCDHHKKYRTCFTFWCTCNSSYVWIYIGLFWNDYTFTCHCRKRTEAPIPFSQLPLVLTTYLFNPSAHWHVISTEHVFLISPVLETLPFSGSSHGIIYFSYRGESGNLWVDFSDLKFFFKDFLKIKKNSFISNWRIIALACYIGFYCTTMWLI